MRGCSKRNKYATVAGFAYKEAVIDELAAKREEDYITKISIQIRG